MERVPKRLPTELKRPTKAGCMRYFRDKQAELLALDERWRGEFHKRLNLGQSEKFAAIGATAVVFDLKTALVLAKN